MKSKSLLVKASRIKELGIAGDAFYLQGPVQFDYGCFTSIGKNSYANFNLTCVDCCPVTIGDNCWLAVNVTVCGGVMIGEGCVIGAGSVVTRDIHANTLAVGVPCRPIREITAEDALENHPELF